MDMPILPLRRTRRPAPAWSISYCVWTLSAPLPLETFAGFIDVRTLLTSPVVCCIKFPTYFSITDCCFLRCQAILTQANFLALFLTFSSFFLLRKDIEQAPGEEDHNILKLLKGLKISIALTLSRGIVRAAWSHMMDQRHGTGLSELEKGHRLYQMDLLWSSQNEAIACMFLMHGFSLAQEPLAKSGMPTFHIKFITTSIYFFVTSLLIDFVYGWVWLCMAKSLYCRFIQSEAAHRGSQDIAALASTAIAEECAICLSSEDLESCKMPCGHIFHRVCLESWARAGVMSVTSCPLCRTAVQESPVV